MSLQTRLPVWRSRTVDCHTAAPSSAVPLATCAKGVGHKGAAAGGAEPRGLAEEGEGAL